MMSQRARLPLHVVDVYFDELVERVGVAQQLDVRGGGVAHGDCSVQLLETEAAARFQIDGDATEELIDVLMSVT